MTLTQYLQSWEGQQFHWSERACVHFVAGWALHHLDRDPLLELPQPLPTTLLGWSRLSQSCGGVETLIGRALGRDGVTPSLAMPGAVLLFIGHQVGFTLGLCVGRQAAVPAEVGLTYLNSLDAVKAWNL